MEWVEDELDSRDAVVAEECFRRLKIEGSLIWEWPWVTELLREWVLLLSRLLRGSDGGRRAEAVAVFVLVVVEVVVIVVEPCCIKGAPLVLACCSSLLVAPMVLFALC